MTLKYLRGERRLMNRIVLGLVAIAIVGFVVPTSATALSVSWSGVDINTNEGTFAPSGMAEFSYDSTSMELTIELTSTSSEEKNWQVLTGLAFDVAGDITLAPVKATASALVAPPGSSDISDHWAYNDSVSAGLLGSNAISAVGDILFGVDEIGSLCMDNAKCAGGDIGGVDYGVVGEFANLGSNSFKNSGPFVQDTATFVFMVSGFDKNSVLKNISNVDPLFGSSGAGLIPEPSAALLFSVGGLVVGASVRRRRR